MGTGGTDSQGFASPSVDGEARARRDRREHSPAAAVHHRYVISDLMNPSLFHSKRRAQARPTARGRPPPERAPARSRRRDRAAIYSSSPAPTASPRLTTPQSSTFRPLHLSLPQTVESHGSRSWASQQGPHGRGHQTSSANASSRCERSTASVRREIPNVPGMEVWFHAPPTFVSSSPATSTSASWVRRSELAARRASSWCARSAAAASPSRCTRLGMMSRASRPAPDKRWSRSAPSCGDGVNSRSSSLDQGFEHVELSTADGAGAAPAMGAAVAFFVSSGTAVQPCRSRVAALESQGVLVASRTALLHRAQARRIIPDAGASRRTFAPTVSSWSPRTCAGPAEEVDAPRERCRSAASPPGAPPSPPSRPRDGGRRRMEPSPSHAVPRTRIYETVKAP